MELGARCGRVGSSGGIGVRVLGSGARGLDNHFHSFPGHHRRDEACPHLHQAHLIPSTCPVFIILPPRLTFVTGLVPGTSSTTPGTCMYMPGAFLPHWRIQPPLALGQFSVRWLLCLPGLDALVPDLESIWCYKYLGIVGKVESIPASPQTAKVLPAPAPSSGRPLSRLSCKTQSSCLRRRPCSLPPTWCTRSTTASRRDTISPWRTSRSPLTLLGEPRRQPTKLKEPPHKMARARPSGTHSHTSSHPEPTARTQMSPVTITTACPRMWS